MWRKTEGCMMGTWTCMQRQRAGRCYFLGQLLQLHSSAKASTCSPLRCLAHRSSALVSSPQTSMSIASWERMSSGRTRQPLVQQLLTVQGSCGDAPPSPCRCPLLTSLCFLLCASFVMPHTHHVCQAQPKSSSVPEKASVQPSPLKLQGMLTAAPPAGQLAHLRS